MCVYTYIHTYSIAVNNTYYIMNILWYKTSTKLSLVKVILAANTKEEGREGGRERRREVHKEEKEEKVSKKGKGKGRKGKVISSSYKF